MRLLISMILLLAQVEMASAKAPAGKKAVRKGNPELGTSFRFDGASINGKLPSSASTSATVEDDKFLEDLIGARKDFKDRAARDQERQ